MQSLAALSIANDIILLEAWSTFDPHYLAHFIMECILFYRYPIMCMHLITRFYGTVIICGCTMCVDCYVTVSMLEFVYTILSTYSILLQCKLTGVKAAFIHHKFRRLHCISLLSLLSPSHNHQLLPAQPPPISCLQR